MMMISSVQIFQVETSFDKTILKSLYIVAKKIFLRQYIIVIMVQSIENIIVNSIKKCGRGAVFFPSDFSKVGERSAVLKALKQMTDRGHHQGRKRHLLLSQN